MKINIKRIRAGLISYTPPDGSTVWQLYDTVIVILRGRVLTLSHGTYKTKHTKHCLNDILEPMGYQIVQFNGKWLVRLPNGHEKEFRNGMTIEDRRPGHDQA